MTEEFRRTLAAILCADVVGYSRLMAGEESATHAAYKNYLDHVVRPSLDSHRGRLVKSTGDGFIAVFDSVVDGVACALEIQEGVARDEGRPRLTFRIGVNVGDIIVEEGDVFGDGVNIAARLQALAPPGGVCVSALLRDQIRGKLQVEFESLGRKRVKKSDIPLHAYAVLARADFYRRTPISRIAARARPIMWRTRVISLTTIAVCAAALVAWQADLGPVRRFAEHIIGTEAPGFPLPDRPSLVVLPFKVIGAGQDQEYFADGISEDVITDLARIGGLFVIARTSSFVYKDRPRDVRKIGHDLGVRYALEGSVRRADGKVRIVAQLIDAKSGGHVWAARYDRPLGDIFKIQDEITQKIVQALAIKIGELQVAQSRGNRPTSTAAYDAYLRGRAAYRRNTFEEYQKAIKYFDAAIKIDPSFAQAHAALAAAYLSARLYSWTRIESFSSPLQTVLNARRHDEELLSKAREHLARALQNPTSLAYRSAAEILIFERKHNEAVAEIRKAIALDPNNADNFALLSSALTWAGQAGAAVEPIRRAMRLNPHHPPLYFCHYGTALFTLELYKEAAQEFERCQRGNPDNQWAYLYLIATYAYLGENSKVMATRSRVSELLRRQGRSPFTVKEARRRMPYRYRADLLRLLVGLHKGNVPDSLVQAQ